MGLYYSPSKGKITFTNDNERAIIVSGRPEWTGDGLCYEGWTVAEVHSAARSGLSQLGPSRSRIHWWNIFITLSVCFATGILGCLIAILLGKE